MMKDLVIDEQGLWLLEQNTDRQMMFSDTMWQGDVFSWDQIVDVTAEWTDMRR